MSRAFVKEMEDAPEPGVLRPQSQHPNYVTAAGVKQLQERLKAATAAGDDNERMFWQSRVDSAIVIKKADQDRSVVDFGATVTVGIPDGKQQTYTIVGEDEADPLHGKISWVSPLAQALMEQKPGAKVLWRRPAGDIPVQLVKIEYRR